MFDKHVVFLYIWQHQGKLMTQNEEFMPPRMCCCASTCKSQKLIKVLVDSLMPVAFVLGV